MWSDFRSIENRLLTAPKDSEDWEKNHRKIRETLGFPLCPKRSWWQTHSIECPKNCEHNYKSYYSVILLAVCDAIIVLRYLISVHVTITTTPPHIFFKGGGGVNFDYLPRWWEYLKNFKKGAEVCSGAGLLKKTPFLFNFSSFIVFTSRNYFTLCKIVLCIWRKIIFFCHHNFMKKGHSKLSKNEPENITQMKIELFAKEFKRLKLIFDRKRQVNW